MSANGPSVRDVLIAAGVVFGRGKTIQDIALRVDAYTKILDLDRELGETIDEFDLIRGLEEVQTFLPTDELRKLANELGILERRAEGLMRVKPTLFLDDILPGRNPSDIPPLPSDFVNLLGQEENLSVDVGGVCSTIEGILRAVPKVLQAAQDSPIDFVTPFYRPEHTAADFTLLYEGTPAAATPFLDLYLTVQDTANGAATEVVQQTFQALVAGAGEFVDAYLRNCTVEGEGANIGAFRLEDDDDMPGATLPTSVANASLLSVLAGLHNSSKHEDETTRAERHKAMVGLLRFVLAMQNKDGGWPIYRFPATTRRGKGPQSPSVSLVGLVCFASLLDFSDHADAETNAAIKQAAQNYRMWLARSAVTPLDGMAAWRDGEDRPCVYETAINILACLIVPILDEGGREELDRLIQAAMRYVDENWIVSRDASKNVHRIALRAPEANGPAPLPIHWMSPGHARVLRALSLAYIKRGFFPGFSATAQMQRAAAIICRDCGEGLARRLNDTSVFEVSTSMHYLGALSAYRSALLASRSASGAAR